jgi:hypothetical protein
MAVTRAKGLMWLSMTRITCLDGHQTLASVQRAGILPLTASDGYLVPTSAASSDFLKDEYTLFNLIVSITFPSVGNVNIYITDYTPVI